MNGRAAITAEGMAAFVAAFGCLHITLRRAAAEHKMLGRSGDIYAERRASERLADGECRGIDLHFEGDLAPVEAFRDNAGSHMTQRWRRQSRANPSLENGLKFPPRRGK